jgi:hypothetical protein
VRVHLAHQERLVATARNHLADDLFGPAVAIHLRGIDQRHAEVEAHRQCGDLLRRATWALAHRPGAETQRRHIRAIAKRDLGQGLHRTFEGGARAAFADHVLSRIPSESQPACETMCALRYHCESDS